jgi:hypothetical protein
MREPFIYSAAEDLTVAGSPALSPKLLLHFADRDLRFALDLLGGVALDRANDIVGFTAQLFGLPCGNIFTSHWDLRG